MPVKKVKGGFKVENVNKVHKTRKKAELQHRAIKAEQSRRKRQGKS